MANPVLGLRIGGTKQRRSGFTPLINIGILAGNEGVNMDRLTLVTEKPTYIIKHTPDYILYSLIDGRVKSFDADAPGILSIALTIPSGMKLAGGKSPYTLLKEAYDTFRNLYMEPTTDGRDSFKNENYDTDVFQTIVDRYALEPRGGKYIQMNPSGMTGVVKVSEYNLDDFFANTQYPEFSKYKEIEIGVACDDKISPELSKIKIPLPPPRYIIYINGKTTNDYVEYPDDRVTASLPESTDYSYTPISFTLQDLMDAPDHSISEKGSTARLDKNKEEIICELHKEPKFFNVKLGNGGSENDVWERVYEGLQRGQVKILSNGEDFTYLCLKNGVLAPDIARSFFPKFSSSSVAIDGVTYSLTLRKTLDEYNRDIFLTAVIEKKVKAPVVTFGNDAPDKNVEKVGEDGNNNNGGTKNKREEGNLNKEKGKDHKDDLDNKKKGGFLWIIVCVGMALLAALIWLFIRMNQVDPPVVEENDKDMIELSEHAKETGDKQPEDPSALMPVEPINEEPSEKTNIEPEKTDNPKNQPEVITTAEKSETPKVGNKDDKKSQKPVKETIAISPEEVQSKVEEVLGNRGLSNSAKIRKIREIWDKGDPNKEVISGNMRNAIEAVLDINKYKKLSPDKQAIIKALIDSHKSYDSMGEVMQTYQEIKEIM